nr:RING-H2 finger protein ATL67-like [Tanacetum cinerariifolium]
MATSCMSCSVGILFHHSRLFIKVNAQQRDHVDEVMLINKTSKDQCNHKFEAIFQDYEGNKSMLFDDYKTLQMELTINHGAIDTIRLFDEFGPELVGEQNHKVSMEIAACIV